MPITNAEFIQSLKSRGVKTTSTGKKEANFSDYGNALSDKLQKRILDSFDNEADYALQSRIAGLFSKKNVLQKADFIKQCKALGITVKCESVNTSYIVDNKATGNNKNATKGNINVYTLSDGNGGEIVIADANGNAAIESEELFMNEILSGVTSSINADSSGAAGASGSGSASGGSSPTGASPSGLAPTGSLGGEAQGDGDTRQKVTSAVYEQKVKDYMEAKGWSKESATSEVDKSYVIDDSGIAA